jgi:S-adenosylmethionine synthetase
MVVPFMQHTGINRREKTTQLQKQKGRSIMQKDTSQTETDMGMRSRLLVASCETSESITAGHPDKVMDQIADSILDAALVQDPLSRVAIDGAGGRNNIMITGEVTTNAVLNIPDIVNSRYRSIGYTDRLNVMVNIVQQSSNIKAGVDAKADSEGAGDQGIMVGYATRETPELLPTSYALARRLTNRLTELRSSREMPYVLPDGKSQVTVENGRVTSVVIACNYQAGTPIEQVRKDVLQHVITPVIGALESVTVRINNTGSFEIGGLVADSGEVGRKIVADAYGPRVPVGGGAFSGKDPTKVDRSAAYMCRFVARQLLKKLGDESEMLVRVAYAIGQPEPEMISAIGNSGHDYSDMAEEFDFRVGAIIERLGLRKPNGWSYAQTAAAGHFCNPAFPWEQ